MRPIFQTDYDQDIRLMRHSGYWWSYGALLLLVILAPLVVGSYLQSQIVFVFIYAIVGVGLLILAGFAGQVSLGHAAFLAIGAYTAGYMQRLGVPFLVYLPLSVVISAAVGALVGFPALRLSGIYLVIATIAFGFIMEEVAARWESVTNGNDG
jgi:branched-chain amino acid transport system permease protein